MSRITNYKLYTLPPWNSNHQHYQISTLYLLFSIWYSYFFTLFMSFVHYIDQNPRKASSRSWIFFNSLVYMFVGLYGTSWPNKKRYRPEIWYTHSLKPYLKMGFLVFSLKRSWGPEVTKNCRVTWIFRIYPRLPFWFLLPEESAL